jgi:hypothetical protein
VGAHGHHRRCRHSSASGNLRSDPAAPSPAIRIGAIGSKKSWASTGRALYDYFSFLQAHERSWDDVDRCEEKTLLATYRDYSFEVAKLARSTMRNGLLYVCEFYSFAQRQKWIETLPEPRSTRLNHSAPSAQSMI